MYVPALSLRLLCRNSPIDRCTELGGTLVAIVKVVPLGEDALGELEDGIIVLVGGVLALNVFESLNTLQRCCDILDVLCSQPVGLFFAILQALVPQSMLRPCSSDSKVSMSPP